MLVRALRLRGCLSAYAEGLLSSDDWAYYQRIVNFLMPFKECTLFLNGDKWVSLSWIVPLYNKLIDHVESTLMSMDADDDLYDAIDAAKQKLVAYYNASSELCTAATLLDPRLKTSPYEDGWLPGPFLLDPGTNHVGEQTAAVIRHVQADFIRGYTPGQVSVAAAVHHAEARSGFVGSMLPKKKKRSGSSPADLADEFKRYIALLEVDEDVDPLQWWKIHSTDFPNLSRMAKVRQTTSVNLTSKDYLAIPATEASAERQFSGGKRLITDERCSLAPETIRAVMCLKSWLK